jgi:hypothetical protein
MSVDPSAISCPDCKSTRVKSTGMQVTFDRGADAAPDAPSAPRSAVYRYECEQ